MDIRLATINDFDTLKIHEHHISPSQLKNCILREQVYIAEENGIFAGWLRYNFFWDSIPFMNMLYVLDGYRGRGFGKCLVLHWESEMLHAGYKTTMTSTASDEYAQHFYNKLGYAAIGGFIFGSDPFEVILSKVISRGEM